MGRRLVTVLFFFGMSVTARADTVWLKGGSVVDPATQKILRTDLRISNGKLQRQTAPKAFKPGERVIDITGKYIIPGIYDMHVHSSFGNPGPGDSRQDLTPIETSRLVLRTGVTGFLDLFADENEIFSARDEIRRTKEGAEIFAAGPMLTCPQGHGSDLGRPTRLVTSVKEAEKQVDELAKKHPDVVKMSYDHAGEQVPPKPVMNESLLKAIIRTAKKHNLRTVVHIGNWDDAKAAVLAGATIVTHLHETDIPDSLVALMKERKTIEIPTMAYQTEALHILENRDLLNSPLLVSLIPANLLNAYRRMDPSEPFLHRVLDWQSRGRDSFPRSLAKLIKAGIPIFCGTDSGDIGVFHGYSVHREMVMMVNAGATSWTALASATTLPKKFLRRTSGIENGDEADLVVIEGNPIEDIANTQNVRLVFHAGNLALDQRDLTTSP